MGRKVVQFLVPISRRFLMLLGAPSPTPCIGRKDVRFLILIGDAASGIPIGAAASGHNASMIAMHQLRRQAATTPA
jgi:hypothetical protein